MNERLRDAGSGMHGHGFGFAVAPGLADARRVVKPDTGSNGSSGLPASQGSDKDGSGG
jgi:hypothetical protein